MFVLVQFLPKDLQNNHVYKQRLIAGNSGVANQGNKSLPKSGVNSFFDSLANLKLGSGCSHERSSATGSSPLPLFLEAEKGLFLLDLNHRRTYILYEL